MHYQKYPMSEQLKGYSKQKQMVRDKGLDFEDLLPGESYALPLDKCNVTSLTSQYSKWGRKLNRNFKLYVHYDQAIVEVGRLDGIVTTPLE